MPSHGSQIAKPVPVADGAKTVRLIKRYDRPEFKTKPSGVEIASADRVTISLLKMEIAALRDKQRRLREEIEDTVKMLTAAMDENKEETVDQVRRRISRLKGALEYQGRYDFATEED